MTLIQAELPLIGFCSLNVWSEFHGVGSARPKEDVFLAWFFGVVVRRRRNAVTPLAYGVSIGALHLVWSLIRQRPEIGWRDGRVSF